MEGILKRREQEKNKIRGKIERMVYGRDTEMERIRKKRKKRKKEWKQKKPRGNGGKKYI